MTEALFRDDPYLRSCEARIAGIDENGAIRLDRTVFFATGGGQPGDTGEIELEDGRRLTIASTQFANGKQDIVHLPAAPADLPPAGTPVVAHIDWPRRYRHMRMHTALHIICAAMDTGITGCQIGAEESRIDLDMPEAPDRDAVLEEIMAAVEADYPVTSEWITDEQLDANPDLIKSMSVSPPRGSGRVRLIRIGNTFDLQPCGGTHVASTAEVGRVEITKIEKKGRLNRRIRIRLAD